MTAVEIACAEPAFLDLTFAGLESVPLPGEERLADQLLRSPGGGAVTAIAAARLGLASALVSPLGDDLSGEWLLGALERDGVRFAGRRVERTPLTVVMPSGGDRALATFDPGEEATAAELAAVDSEAVVVSIAQVAIAPPAARIYVTVRDIEARALAGRPLPRLVHTRALIVNEREAFLLTGETTPAGAARRLATNAPVAIVTLESRGALAASADGTIHADGIAVETVDSSGAGDLFAAAYAWADGHGLPLRQRVEWAVLYASLSVRVATAVAGALTLTELLQAGEERGLPLPAKAGSAPFA